MATLWADLRIRALALTKDGRPRVRQGVARNKSAPQEALALLAHDAAVVVREWVARHRNTPSLALEVLARDADVFVLRALRGRVERMRSSAAQ